MTLYEQLKVENKRLERENERLKARLRKACEIACRCPAHDGCAIHRLEVKWAREDEQKG